MSLIAISPGSGSTSSDGWRLGGYSASLQFGVKDSTPLRNAMLGVDSTRLDSIFPMFWVLHLPLLSIFLQFWVGASFLYFPLSFPHHTCGVRSRGVDFHIRSCMVLGS
ncbi:hypothetical protein BDV06DRAFT_17245 [Aspergillus oleicola]